MKINRFFLFLIFSFLFGGCASYTPPKSKEIKRSDLVPISYDKAWNDTVEFLALRNLTIDKIEKESGLINGSATLSDVSEYLDCGKITGGGENRYDNAGFRISVILREKNENNTNVMVTVVGAANISAFSWGATIATNYEKRVSTSCHSTGVIEEDLFSYLNNK